jgi:hypothetical protein
MWLPRQSPPDPVATARGSDMLFLKIVDHFGAARYETQKVEGHWRHGGVIVRDNLVKIVIDTPDSQTNRRWMRQYKDRWRSKLEQTELWMVSYAVEVE